MVLSCKRCGRPQATEGAAASFECPDLTEKQLLDLRAKLEAFIDHGVDSIHYFRLCRACVKEVEWSGIGRKPAVAVFRVA